MSAFYIKCFIYGLSLVASFYGLEALHYDRLIKGNHIRQAWVLYLLLAFALAYMVGSFVLVFWPFGFLD